MDRVAAGQIFTQYILPLENHFIRRALRRPWGGQSKRLPARAAFTSAAKSTIPTIKLLYAALVVCGRSTLVSCGYSMRLTTEYPIGEGDRHALNVDSYKQIPRTINVSKRQHALVLEYIADDGARTYV
jgi:hypothetical protein